MNKLTDLVAAALQWAAAELDYPHANFDAELELKQELLHRAASEFVDEARERLKVWVCGCSAVYAGEPYLQVYEKEPNIKDCHRMDCGWGIIERLERA